MSIVVDLRVAIKLLRRKRSLTSWGRFAKVLKHNPNVLQNHFASEGLVDKVEEWFRKNKSWRRARREKRIRLAMLIHLSRLTRELGYTPGKAELRESGRFSFRMYVIHFGSLREAQRQADLIPNEQGRHGHLEIRQRYSLPV